MKYLLSCLGFILVCSVAARSQAVYTLQQCIDSALANNIQVKRAGLLTETAAINRQQSRSDLLPNVNAALSHGLNSGRSIDPSTNSFVNQNVNGAHYSIYSNVILLNGLTLQNRIRQNSFAYEASKLEHQQFKEELVLNIILTYLSVLNNEDQVNLALKQEGSSQATLDRLKVLNNQGAIKPSDLSDLTGQLMNDQLNILTAKNNLESSKLALFQLMNKNYDPALQVVPITAGEFPGLYQMGVHDVYASSLQHFASVKAVFFRKESARYAVNAAKGQLYPQLSLGAGLSTRYSNLATNAGVKLPFPEQLKNFKNSSFEVGLTIPVFNRSFARNKIRIAKIELRDYQLNEENVRQQLHQQIEQAYMNMTNAYNRFRVLQTQVSAYSESFNAAEIRFQSGVGTSIDYLSAKDRLDRANINLVNARYDFILRKKILDFYSGNTKGIQ